jgi:protein-S-isoprenylcysteine O-methyltransferase Ste14
MRDLPAVLLVATVWAYWFGVGVMIVRVRRETPTLGGLIPEVRIEQYLWLLWVPVVAAWLALPYLAVARPGSHWAAPPIARSSPIYDALRWFAAAVGLTSLLLTSRCWGRMGRNWRMAVSTERKGELITDGPFRYVRHPIYALQRLLMLCSLVILPTWPMLVLAALHWACTQIKSHHEEAHLLGVHGETYRSYQERTGRFLPQSRAASRADAAQTPPGES